MALDSTQVDLGSGRKSSLEIKTVYRDGTLKKLEVKNPERRTSETYIRNSCPSKKEPYGTFSFTGIYPGSEEVTKKVNPVGIGNGFERDLLRGEDPFSVAEKHHITIHAEQWYRTGANFETNGPIYTNLKTGETEGVSRDKETEGKKRGTRRLLRSASGRLNSL